jgi:hypothetical protein
VHFGESENFEGTKNPLRGGRGEDEGRTRGGRGEDEGKRKVRDCPQKVEKSGDKARKISHKPRKK